jgi:hypothetical protein
MIERTTSLPFRDHGVTPEFVMGMAQFIRYVSYTVAKDYGQYILENEDTVSTSQTAAFRKDYARGFILKVTPVQVMHAFKKKCFGVDCDGVVEDLMSTIQEQVTSFQKNAKSTRKLLRKHLNMPLYYAITNGNATYLPLTWASIKQGRIHASF